MIKGLEMAGANPTQAAVIKDLRGLKSYNANGLLPQSIDYSTIFGHDPAKTCAWVMQAEKTGFTMASSPAVLRDGPPGDVDRQRHFIGTDVTPGDGANGGSGPRGARPHRGRHWRDRRHPAEG